MRTPVIRTFRPEQPAARVRLEFRGHAEAMSGGGGRQSGSSHKPAILARRPSHGAVLASPAMTNPNPTSPQPVPPAAGAKITTRDGKLSVPDQPIIPFIEGDGTGRDIWRAS